MMKLPLEKVLSVKIKILIVVVFIIAVAVWDYRLFLGASEKIWIYDDMHSKLSYVRVSLAKLDHTLEIVVAARHLDNTKLMLMIRDVEQLDRGINEVMLSPVFSPIMKGNPQIWDNLEAISELWQPIKNDFLRLKETVSLEELLLIHNDADVNAMLMSEMNDRVMGIISQGRSDILDDINLLALGNCVGFAFISIACAFLFYRRAYYPAIEATRTAEMIQTGLAISSGSGTYVFNEAGGGFMGTLAFKLNLMLAAVKERIIVMDKRAGEMSEELTRRAARLEAVNAMNASIARSPSLDDVFSIAVKEAVTSGGADGAGVCFVEDGFLRFKASSGLGGTFFDEGPSLPLDAFEGMQDDMSTRIFSSIEDYPYEIMRPHLRSAGYVSLMSVPVRRDMKTVGYFYATFKGAPPEAGAPFFEAAALGMEAYLGYTWVCSMERNLRRFFERVAEQIPMGIAVFDNGGVCAFASSHLKKLLNVHPGFAFAGAYSIMEDDAFGSEAVRGHIRNVYAGYTAEFMIEYAPSLTARFGFGTSSKMFRVKGSPLYDAGGEISNIMLLYEPAVDETPKQG